MNKVQYTHTDVVHNTISADIILPIVFNFLEVKSVLDIGCGTGTWLSVVKKLGISDIQGVDGDQVDLSKLHIERSYFTAHDLRQELNLNRHFDLVICLEVAEHLSKESESVLLNTLVNHSSSILFSAALPGQGGQNHLNEQPFSYWKRQFENIGFVVYDIIRPFIWNDNRVDWWYAQNCFLATKLNIENKLAQTEVPKIFDLIHPKLYEYRINDINSFKEYLELDSNKFDNYKMEKPGRRRLLKFLLKGIIR